MAGHSRWANVKHRKERADAKKGKIFSRIAKEIISAVKVGGADPKGNARLRLAIQKARDENVPNDIIERNIKKASSADQADYVEVTYELYGHGGVGIIAEGMTDNKNRMASEIRIAINKRGGTIANPGSVVFNFEKKGVIQVLKKQAQYEELFLVATEAGAEDLEEVDDSYIITTSPEDFLNVKQAITQMGVAIEEAELEMVPKVSVDVDAETMKANNDLIEWLEGIDDIDTVWNNMKTPD